MRLRPAQRGSHVGIDIPPLQVSPELEWVCQRAFGSHEAAADGALLNDQRVADMMVRLDVAARIGSRIPERQIRHEVGEAAAAMAQEARDEAALQVASLRRLLQDVAKAAADRGMPAAVLKGMAYQLNRTLAPGSRPTGDLDLLVPAARAQELFEALLHLGWHQPRTHGTEFHLPVLQHPYGMVLEIHTRVPCLEREPGIPMSLEDLRQGDWLRPAPGLPGECHLPREELLMAHLLGHFFWQHRQSPLIYPLCRMLLDCVDLRWEAARWEVFRERGYPLVARLVPWPLVAATRELTTRLTAGESVAEITAGNGEPARVLRHAVLGTFDPVYRSHFTGVEVVRFAGGGRLARVLVFALGRLWRPRHQLETKFGAGGGHGARAWRRLRGVVTPLVTTVKIGVPWIVALVRERFPRRPQV